MKISASALKAYLACPRRYWLEYVRRAPREVPSYVTGGLSLDQAVNDYLAPPPPGGNGGQLSLPFPEHAELTALKPLLPAPGTVMVQPELRTPAPVATWGLGEGGPLEVFGKLDALTPPSFERMVIIDVKRVYTKSAALDETTLLDDVQAQLYAWLVWRTYLPARVFGRWTYYVRDTKKAHVVDVEFDRARVEQWTHDVVAPAVRGMLELQERLDALEIEHDPSTCADGKRCFVSNHCPLFRGPMKGEQTVELRKRNKSSKPVVEVNPPTYADEQGGLHSTPEAAVPPPTPEEQRYEEAAQRDLKLYGEVTDGTMFANPPKKEQSTPVNPLDEVRAASEALHAVCRKYNISLNVEFFL
jgi:hypothetical protein